jgi:hypothetical protein
MSVHYRKYGKIVEITEVEKEPNKVRIYTPRIKPDIIGARRSDNIRRTKKICVWRMSAALEEFGCPLLITLTFDGDASDAAYANEALSIFQVRLRTKFPEAQSAFVPELSPRGRIHFHGLVFNVPLSLGDTCEGKRVVLIGEERKTRLLAGLWAEGFVDAKKTDGSRKLAYYISKYINKGAGETLFNGMRILRTSNGFPKQIELSGWVAEELQRRYANKKPISEWEGDNIFLGKIFKKTYLQEP